MASSTSHKEYLVSLVSSFIGLTEDFSGNSGMGLLLEGSLPDTEGKQRGPQCHKSIRLQ
jgi:hypothetical protein